jgi:hypothetical protein
VERGLAHLQGLQHGRQILPSIEHRVRITQLPHNLLRTFASSSSRVSLPSWAATTLITYGSGFGEQATSLPVFHLTLGDE